MKKKNYVKIMLLLVIGLIFGGFIVALSWTFGNSVPGQVLGTMQGVIIFILAAYVAFIKQVNGFFKRLFKKS